MIRKAGLVAATADTSRAIVSIGRIEKLTKGRPTEKIDKHIAARLRQCRAVCGLSQREVAAVIGVTYRQMHKYERGLNRIPAGSLYEIARLLDTPIEYFYYGLPQEVRRPNTTEQSTLLETTYHFSAIKNEKHQEAFSQLVRALAGQRN